MITQDEVRSLREGAGITQAACAELIGVSLRTWQRWEWGASRPRAESIRLFCALTKQALPPSLKTAPKRPRKRLRAPARTKPVDDRE